MSPKVTLTVVQHLNCSVIAPPPVLERLARLVFCAAALRQARRDRQLVSRRLLPCEDEDHSEVTMDTGVQVGSHHLILCMSTFSTAFHDQLPA